MTGTIQTFLLLLGVLAFVAVLARRVDTAPSILLVLTGIALAAIPGIPPIVLAPEFVLLVVLPPLIYSAGVSMSWREVCFNLRPITLLAFGCVVFTTCAVAAAAHLLFNLSWPVAFVLGAIIAPPDVVAPLAIARRLDLPRRLLVVLEGEGLANDATALILYRFAVVAVATGAFSPLAAGGTFAAIVVGEIAYGIGVGWLSLRLRRWADDPRVEITLSLMTPYIAYWVPEHLGGSGVLATVATGLYVSWNGPLLIPATTRLQGIFFWDFVIYLIEGFIFLVTGLQTRTLWDEMHPGSMQHFLLVTVATALIVIVARFVWVFPATYLPRWLIPAIRRRDPSPPWQQPFVIAFTGVRGVVSLAAALAIPLTVASGAPFPDRDLILFVTFGVIVITLVGQGLLLPFVIRRLGLAHHGAAERKREHELEMDARSAALDASRRRLQALANEYSLSAATLNHLSERQNHRHRLFPDGMREDSEEATIAARVRFEMIATERALIYELLRKGQLTDESRRRIERELDLEEAELAHALACEALPL
jgi:Na+/H+ antiporter